MYFREPNGDFRLSADMESWLGQFRAEFLEIENSPDTLFHSDLPKTLMETLEEMKEFGRMHMLRETFYDFISHTENRKRQTAAVLLRRLLRREKDRLPPLGNGGWFDWQNRRLCSSRQRVKRYLAVLGNPELRSKLFGF